MPIDPLTSLFAQIQEQNRYGPQRAFAQVGQGITQGTNSIVEALQRIAQQKRQDILLQQERDFRTKRAETADTAARALQAQRSADELAALGMKQAEASKQLGIDRKREDADKKTMRLQNMRSILGQRAKALYDVAKDLDTPDNVRAKAMADLERIGAQIETLDSQLGISLPTPIGPQLPAGGAPAQQPAPAGPPAKPPPDTGLAEAMAFRGKQKEFEAKKTERIAKRAAVLEDIASRSIAKSAPGLSLREADAGNRMMRQRGNRAATRLSSIIEKNDLQKILVVGDRENLASFDTDGLALSRIVQAFANGERDPEKLIVIARRGDGEPVIAPYGGAGNMPQPKTPPDVLRLFIAYLNENYGAK